MIKISNIKYNTDDANAYYNILETQYSKYKWHYVKHHNDPRSIGSNNNLYSMYGYGLQTIYADLKFPYHCDIDPHDEGPQYFKDTELIFGFFANLKSKFTNVYRSFLLTFGCNNYIGKWNPGSTNHIRCFVPISASTIPWLSYYESNVKHSIVPEVGKIYELDMIKNNYIEINNISETNVTFIMFNYIKDHNEFY